VCPSELPSRRITVSKIDPTFRVVSLPRLSQETRYIGMGLRAALISVMRMAGDIDVVHACAPAFPETWLPVVRSHAARVPVAVDIDDWWGEEPVGRRPRLEAALQEFMQRSAVRMASVVLTVSEELEDRFRDLTRVHMIDLPNGVNPDDFAMLNQIECRERLRRSLGLPDEEFLLTCLYDPNFSSLFEALGKRLPKVWPHARLLVVGGPLAGTTLGPRAVERDSETIYLGRLSRRETIETTIGSDLLFFPMLDTMFDRARFPIKIVDHLASGIPTLSTAVGKTRRLLLAAGYSSTPDLLVGRNTVESVVESVSRVSRQMDSAGRTAQTARSYVFDVLSWARIAKDCHAAYELALS
jgi:hypothetical protein